MTESVNRNGCTQSQRAPYFGRTLFFVIYSITHILSRALYFFRYCRYRRYCAKHFFALYFTRDTHIFILLVRNKEFGNPKGELALYRLHTEQPPSLRTAVFCMGKIVLYQHTKYTYEKHNIPRTSWSDLLP